MTWQENVLNRDLPANRAKDLQPTIKLLFTDMMQEKPIDYTFVKLPVNPLHLAVCLRVNVEPNRNTPGWSEALELCRQQCITDGIDPNDALYGMI